MTNGFTLIKQRVFHSNGKESKQFTQTLKNVEKVLANLETTEKQIKKWLVDAEKLHKTTVNIRNSINLTTPLDRRPATEEAGVYLETSKGIQSVSGRPMSMPAPVSRQPSARPGRKLDRTALIDIQAKIKSIRALANTAKSDLQKERVEWKRAQRKHLKYAGKAARCDGEDMEAKKQKYEQKMNYWQEKEVALKQKQSAHCKELFEKMQEIKCKVDKDGSHALIRQELATIKQVQHEYFTGCIDEV
mmetsp:Transcript_7030/g.11169  ORF Transcript_7030/g.11169 Transcript_7030/m.11169 type:complete len:246 (+) Transcript_7030:41-778(+)|eukprot:CAMPEP_0203745876 /NCGR_PEP_ID=MMETSP0098-20131031/1482_1 /ASSEMBLY_ACC=CAM_ASM_000208 /TAXON_ID=96639 /ORGANISM=" , Strain NY0313808BC1" /LENGTH=245 /DNA_ID=CAMNT_0050633785 /DNA_START=50 /DNA_END=787 /DNA_ORIENTATION=+